MDPGEDLPDIADKKELAKMIKDLSEKMKESAQKLDFEKAAEYRDKIRDLQKLDIFLG